MLSFKAKKKSLISNQWLKKSYSQSGEDLIVKFIFDTLGITHPSYLDIGAHHPYYLSNTALFYELGCTGINVEPDPNLFKAFLDHRKEDKNINIGISSEKGSAEFYIISVPTLNTFSKHDAENYKNEGNYSISEVITIPTNSITNIIEEYNLGEFPQFLNVDAEGIDEIIIKSIDFSKSYPIVICIETLTFSSTGNGIKNDSVEKYLSQNGYMVYADTNINTIFVRRDLWQRSV
ncbi:MAG: FkbM family methyltransferase [Chryseobacterium sp.]|nr:MAG: FkbM family methyltransferase [Chryseobacterium sp.]